MQVFFLELCDLFFSAFLSVICISVIVSMTICCNQYRFLIIVNLCSSLTTFKSFIYLYNCKEMKCVVDKVIFRVIVTNQIDVRDLTYRDCLSYNQFSV